MNIEYRMEFDCLNVMLSLDILGYLLIMSAFSTFLYWAIIRKVVKRNTKKILWISSPVVFISYMLVAHHTLFMMISPGAFVTVLIYVMRGFATAGLLLALYMLWQKLFSRKRRRKQEF